jgi:hypothetical protein
MGAGVGARIEIEVLKSPTSAGSAFSMILSEMI